MNIEEAKAIPMAEFLEKLGYIPEKNYPTKALYKSPLRIEKTASFWLCKVKNAWYDHGLEKGGGILQFAIEYLKSQNVDHTAGDGLRFINLIWKNASTTPFVAEIQPDEQEKYKLKIETVSALKHSALLNYLLDRCIPKELAKRYFKEVQVRNANTGKFFKAIGLKNEAGGYEIRNKLLKASVGEKDISFIRGSDENRTKIHVFEGMMDFVSILVLSDTTQFVDDVIILNSLSRLKKAIPYITNYTYQEVHSWFDNDASGARHREIFNDFIAANRPLKHISHHKEYEGHKDPNDKLVSEKKAAIKKPGAE